MFAKTTGGLIANLLPIFVRDSTSTTGAGLSGLVYNTAGLVAEYRRYGSSSWTAITLVSGATLGSFTSGGWVADGSLAGAYEVGIPNLAFGTNVPWVIVRFYGAANMVPVQYFIELDAIGYSDPIRAGLTALPAVNHSASGGLPTVGNSAGQITLSSGAVTVGTNNDKTGYKLASDGLDTISTTAPSGVASNFREMMVQVWRRFFKKVDMTTTQTKTYADNGSTVLTTQTNSDDGTTQTIGNAS